MAIPTSEFPVQDFAQERYPPQDGGFPVDSCVSASLALAFQGLGHAASIDEFFDSYCREYHVQKSGSSAQRACAENIKVRFNCMGVTGQRLVAATVLLSNEEPFRAARRGFTVTYVGSVTEHLDWLEESLREERCLATVSVSVSLSESHTCCVGHDGTEFYCYETISEADAGPQPIGNTLSNLLRVYGGAGGSQSSLDDGLLIRRRA